MPNILASWQGLYMFNYRSIAFMTGEKKNGCRFSLRLPDNIRCFNNSQFKMQLQRSFLIDLYLLQVTVGTRRA